jgi:hypothetical protein
MPLTRNHEQTIRVHGNCADWFAKCVTALEKARFSQIRADDESFIVDADYRGPTVDGSIRLLLTQERDEVEIEIRIIAAVDNVWAYFRPPLERILRAFVSYLPIRETG